MVKGGGDGITSGNTPMAEDFTVINLTQIQTGVSGVSVTAVTITAKSGKTTGAISNIRYNGSTTIPQNAGTYPITFDVSGAGEWNEASDLSAGTLTVIVPGSFNVSNAAEWAVALSLIGFGGDGTSEVRKAYTINITDSFGIKGTTTNIFFSRTYIDVTINGNNNTISLNDGTGWTTLSTGSLFFIGDNQAVTMVSLTLKGHARNTAPLVNINGTNAAFTMNSGAVTGNKGGGVCLFSGGIFTMNGGEISGNSGTFIGGGVYGANGRFTMNGGTISGNTARTWGGGVYVGGIFRISSGTVYGRNEGGNSNTAGSSAAALFNSNGEAQYGTFDAGGNWTSNGNLKTRNTTIKVVNGEIVQ